ncbi:hypothetical protein KSS87_013873, partial [Heliosperma pusillum]
EIILQGAAVENHITFTQKIYAQQFRYDGELRGQLAVEDNDSQAHEVKRQPHLAFAYTQNSGKRLAELPMAKILTKTGALH